MLGAVLAGGASSRFGADKALALWNGETLLERARAVLAGVTLDVVVVGRGEVSDRPLPGLGPLGGIAGALDHGAREGFDSVLTIGCDMPEVPDGLLAALAGSVPSYCADAPVLGHWPTSLASALIRHLASHTTSSSPDAATRDFEHSTAPAREQCRVPSSPGQRGSRNGALSVRRWAAEIGGRAIPALVPLRNVNTPADLSAP